MAKQKFEWMVSGDCVEGCTSPAVCPLYWNSPTQAQLHGGQSQCEGVWTFSIKEGYSGGIGLSGLMVSYAFNSPSPFPGPKGTPQPPWKAIIYIDEKANAQQGWALEKIYRTCFKVMGDVVTVKRVKIEFKKELVDGGSTARYWVKIDGIYNFETRPFKTVDKKPRYINTYWGGHINIGVSVVNEFNDPDLPRGKWNTPGMSISYYDFVLNPGKHHWLP